MVATPISVGSGDGNKPGMPYGCGAACGRALQDLAPLIGPAAADEGKGTRGVTISE